MTNNSPKALTQFLLISSFVQTMIAPKPYGSELITLQKGDDKDFNELVQSAQVYAKKFRTFMKSKKMKDEEFTALQEEVLPKMEFAYTLFSAIAQMNNEGVTYLTTALEEAIREMEIYVEQQQGEV